MPISLLQPSFLMSKTRSYAQILIGSRVFLTAMAIHLSLRVAPLDLQQGGNSRIPYVHVPAARMSILVYIATAINTFLFLLTKHPLFLRSSGTGTEMGAFSTLFTLVTGGFRGRPMWGTFWVWDARLTSVFISFLIYLGALRFQKLPVELAPISIRAGPIDIPIIKSSVNWWNTSHQPGSISRSGTSIHVPMPIPILSNFANFPFSTRILFVLETRLPIPSFPESPLTEEIEAREGIPKPSSLAESLCIHRKMEPDTFFCIGPLAEVYTPILFARVKERPGESTCVRAMESERGEVEKGALMNKKKSHIRPYILLTLTHAERRQIPPQEVITRILGGFSCLSIVVSTEIHLDGGYHFHVGVYNKDASQKTATKKLRQAFFEFEGRQVNVVFKKGWGPVCYYITKEEKNPVVWGEYTLREILETAQALTNHTKAKAKGEKPRKASAGSRKKAHPISSSSLALSYF